MFECDLSNHLGPKEDDLWKGWTSDEVALLCSILRRATSPMWWARLSYPDEAKYWTPQETAVLHKAGL